MAFNVSSASIRNPLPACVLFAVLLVLGLSAFMALPVTQSPNVDVPFVAVTITESGAAPEELETQVTKKVEDAVASIPGLKHIESTVTDGSSLSLLEFRLEVSPDRATNDVRDAISKIRTVLPRTIDEPVIQRIDTSSLPIQTYAASAPAMTIEQLSWFVDDTVARELQAVPGVGQVLRQGGVTREIAVDLDPDRMAALGITAADVNRQVFSTSVDLAGGKGEVGRREQSIRTLAGATTLADLAATRIVLPGGRDVRLSDLGTVTDGAEEPIAFARLDGSKPVVAFTIQRAKNASDVTVAARVAARLEKLHAQHPDVSYALIDNSVKSTVGQYHSAMESLIEGAVLATIVVLLFLRDWRATLISAAALPLSIIPAFAVISLLGFSLNFMSLLAITLVTGILVDDAIVEIENIVRHIRMGKSAYQAAMEAADEIGLTVIAITLTIVAVFAPVAFMGGVAGQYFKQFGLTVAVAVLASLVVARLITPMMAAYLMRAHGHGADRDPLALRLYARLLGLTLRHRGLTLVAGLALFVIFIGATTLLPTSFMPDFDEARVQVSVELPPGARLEDTRAKTDVIAATFLKIPEVTSVLVLGGNNPTGDAADIRRASVLVHLTPKDDRDRTQKQVEEELAQRLATIPDVRGWFVNDRGERQLGVTMVGTSGRALDRGVAGLEAAMRRLPGFFNVAADAGVARPEIKVSPRPDEAARYGVTTEAISEAVRVATLGDIDANLAKFRDGDRLIPIRVQSERRLRGDLAGIETLPVEGATGLAVPLGAVADVTLTEGPSSIERYDRTRRVKLGADLAGGLALGTALAKVNALPEASHLPDGVALVASGDTEIMGEVFSGFLGAMGAGMMIVLALLVLLFRSVVQPFTVLLSLPLSLGGVILALLLTGDPISLPVAIGILMLMGIVTKNAIMLVDFARERRAHGAPRDEAIMDAGRKRARPIVMTTIAMVAGMFPSALGLGDGGDFRAPMATAVIGGLIVSTALSLVFVPSAYAFMDDLPRIVGRLGRLPRLIRIGVRRRRVPARAARPAEQPVPVPVAR